MAYTLVLPKISWLFRLIFSMMLGSFSIGAPLNQLNNTFSYDGSRVWFNLLTALIYFPFNSANLMNASLNSSRSIFFFPKYS